MIPKTPADEKELARLPSGVTVEQLSRSHRSELRNPLIAEAFHRTGAVEVWGRGTNRVIAECLAYGIPAPVFEELEGWVVVTFRASIVPAGVGRGSREGGEKAGEITREITREKILRAIQGDPEITMAKLARETGLTPKGIEWNIRKLKDAGVLKRIGPDRGGRWEVVP
jgi:ATP-dependent DNA helicase RecG